MIFDDNVNLAIGEVAEWSIALPWKGSIRATVSRVRIPVSPPLYFLFFCSKYTHKGRQMPDFKKQLTTFVQMLRNIEDEFKLHSLTPNEQAVFYTIMKSNDVCNISKIVDESGLSRSTVYKILRKLEDNNLIEAFQSESDKRESIVSLKV